MNPLVFSKYQIATAVLGGGGAVAVGVGAPHMMSSGAKKEEKKEEKKEDEVRETKEKPEEQVQMPQVKPPEAPRERAPEETTTQKVQQLKQRKETLKSDVEQKIGEYRVLANGAWNTAQMENRFKRCHSYDEVKGKVSEEDKKKLSEGFGAVKDDHQKYTDLQGKIDKDLREKETKADKDKENKDNYEEFRKELEKLEGEYRTLTEKASDQRLKTVFLDFGKKLGNAVLECAFKDVVKINDWYGRRDS